MVRVHEAERGKQGKIVIGPHLPHRVPVEDVVLAEVASIMNYLRDHDRAVAQGLDRVDNSGAEEPRASTAPPLSDRGSEGGLLQLPGVDPET